MKIGLDIDGTISADPDYFRDLCQSTYAQNGSVIIISSRSESDEVKDATTAQLREWEIRYDRLYLFKPLKAVEHLCPYSELDWYQE